MAVGVVAGIGVVITVLSFFILMLSIFLLLQKNSRKLEDLLLLGFTPAQASKPYLMLTAVMNLGVVVIAVPIVLALRAAYMPVLSTLGGESYAGGGVMTMILAGLIIAAVITLHNGVAIRRKVWSLWWHESKSTRRTGIIPLDQKYFPCRKYFCTESIFLYRC